MSLSDLQQTLQQQITPERTLLLDTKTLNTPRIIRLFSGVLGADHLALADVSDPQLAGDASSLTLTGQATVLGLASISIVGVFVVHDEQLHFSLQLRLPEGWTFAQSFPELADAADLLEGITLYNAAFVISTVDYHDDTLDLDVAPGLNFTAQIALDGPFAPVQALLACNDLVRLSGAIDFTSLASGRRIPSFAIRAAVPARIELGALAIHDISAELGCMAYADATAEPPEQLGFWVALNGSLSLGEVTAALGASIPADPNGTFEFAATFEGVQLPTFGDIAQLAGGDDLADLLPPQLADAGDIGITALSFGVAPRRKTIEYVSFEVGTASSWTIVPDVLTIDRIGAQWLILAPGDRASRSISATLAGSLALGESQLQIEAELPAAQIHAWLTEDQPLRLVALLQQIIAGLPVPEGFQNLSITRFDLQANPKLKTLNIAAEIDQPLALDVAPFDAAQLEQLALSLDYAPPNSTIALAGTVSLLDIGWQLTAERRATTLPAAPATHGTRPGLPGPRPTTTSEWTFTGRLAEGQTINLPALATKFDPSITLPDGLDIDLNDLEFRVDTGAAKEYEFAGGFEWTYDVGDVSFKIGAGLRLRSWLHDGTTPLPRGVLLPPNTSPAKGVRLREGEVRGVVDLRDVGVDFFDNLTLAAIYTFAPGSSAVKFQFKKGDFELDAGFSRRAEGNIQHTIFTIAFGPDTTFGSLLTLLAQIADPTIEEFELDAPWDELNTLKLSGLQLVIDLTDKELSVVYNVNQTFFDGLVKIGKLGLTITKIDPVTQQPGKTRLIIDVDASVLGKPLPKWDALSQQPPAVPGKGNAVFDLSYLGLGQHIALVGVAELDTVTKVINALRAAVVAADDDRTLPGGVQFDPNSGWLIGAQFKIIDTFALAAIFNDPLLYGMRVELSGARAGQFAGLVFEILYRRISDTIGVYHIELVLPDAMRNLQFGIVALTLPVVVLDIYTNGDFKIDLGFPWNGNFDRSFAINVLIFIGAGGFYFNKLSAATATSVPKIAPEVGRFNPVIEFGLGLKVGLGKTFEKGPLEAEISITVQGVVQGVFAWFHPNRPELPSDQYYMVKGGVAIVGRLWGRVDFEIIQIEVEVVARAMIVFKVESYRATLITLSAEVSVRASITIVFITIHFSFSLTITQSFTLGSDSQAPWERALPPGARAAFAPQAFAAVLSDTEGPALRWRPIPVNGKLQSIDIFFMPAIARSMGGMQGVALLLIENAIAADGAVPGGTDFDLLAKALLQWAIDAWRIDAARIALGDLNALYQAIAATPASSAAPFSFSDLAVFLNANFAFALSSPTTSDRTISAALFPIFPNLVLEAPGADTVDFWGYNQLSAADRQAFAQYFKDISANTAADGTAARDTNTTSAATFMFLDYFALLVRTSVQFAVDILRDRAGQADDLAEQAHQLRKQADANDLRAATLGEQAALLNARAALLNDQAPQQAAELTAQAQDLSQQAARLRAEANALRGDTAASSSGAADLESRAAALRTIGLPDLLAALDTANKFRDLAGITSRFMLHGTRLPWSRGGSTGTAPLYAITGQQLALPKNDKGAYAVDASYALRLRPSGSLPAGTIAPNVRLGTDNDPTLTRPLGADLLALFNSINSAQSPAPPQVAMLPFYADEPRHFNLQHQTVWQSTFANGPAAIFDLPEPMRAYLAAPGADLANLKLLRGEPTPGQGQLPADKITPFAGHAWATRLRIGLRRVATPDGTLERTYLVLGADEEGKQRLSAIWEYLGQTSAQPDLYLLYPNPAGGVLDQTPTSGLLLKTNLSTMSNPSVNLPASQLRVLGEAPAAPAEIYSADLANGRDFIKLLWECSIVASGGYFLHYAANGAGLPDQLFAGAGGTAELVVIVDPAAAHPFSNCVVIPGGFDTTRAVLIAETADTLKTLHVPPGHLGFRVERPRSTDPLGELYQLLGYQIQDSLAFRASNEGLPIGPAADDPRTTADDNLWIYQRVLPLFRFAKRNVDTAPLDPAGNPYAGIMKMAGSAALPEAVLVFAWRDVYGNQLDAGIAKTLPLRYVDELLGINQWPSVAEQYAFAAIAGDAAHVQLAIMLTFNTDEYAHLPPEQSDRISAARSIYERICYQLAQPDIGFTLTTTVLPGVRHAFTSSELGVLRDFARQAYLYLARIDPATKAARAGLLPPSATPRFSTQLKFTLEQASAGQPAYPADVIFPVVVQIDMQRDPDLCDLSLGVPAVQKISAFLKPTATAEAGIASLRTFAADFERAFAGLRLAVGDAAPADDGTSDAPRPLWAVQLGTGGLGYMIDTQQPRFFTAAPLATTLLSGSVPTASYSHDVGLATQPTPRRVEVVDLNVLAHDFLAAIEAFLEPALVVPAALAGPGAQNAVNSILGHKRTLADAISKQVTHLLEPAAGDDLTVGRQLTADLLRQQLLINLVEAYDIETIIQYPVDVTLADGRALPEATAPRLYGQPVAQQVKRTDTGAQVDTPLLNFSLSPAKLPLAPGQSYLTFCFNTRTPEKFEDLTLSLAYRVNEVEHTIADIANIPGFQSSSWLSFILPLDAANIGDVAIPIPLRTYPVPPSLVLHAAEADPDSFERLEDIRQWQYTFVYEHPDVAQDTIDTAVRYNVSPSASDRSPAVSLALGEDAQPAPAGNVPEHLREIFAALVNFSTVYPQLAADLRAFTGAGPADPAAERAAQALEQLAGAVAAAWQKLSSVPGSASPTNAEYQIDEIATTSTREVTIATALNSQLPLVEIPGFKLAVTSPVTRLPDNPQTKMITYTFDQKSPEEVAQDPIYGESSIPDRKLTIQNLDIIEQQNAWGSIWLTRNRELIAGRTTNPVFIYQTPQVSFTNMITPLLLNTRAWYIDTLGAADGQPQILSLNDHLRQLFTALLPASPAQSYDLRVACRYSFALAAGANPDDDLLSELPVLLGPRFTIARTASPNDLIAEYRANLVAKIQAWYQNTKPLQSRGMFIFTVSLFSNLGADQSPSGTNLPLLRIDDLRLRLAAIRFE